MPSSASGRIQRYCDPAYGRPLRGALQNVLHWDFTGIFFVLSGPPVLLAQVLIWAYVTARAAHFVAYLTAQIHDIRATLWTVSSLSVIAMAGYTLARLM